MQYEIFKEQVVVLIDTSDNMLGTWTDPEGVSILHTVARGRQQMWYGSNTCPARISLPFNGCLTQP
jgi:hypothetical protein